MKRQKPFLLYRGVTIWQQYKGAHPLTFRFSLHSGQNEDSGQSFDVRYFPKHYRFGLAIGSPGFVEIRTEEDARRYGAALRDQEDAHRTVLQRAIDDDYDFAAAALGNYLQFLRRFARYINARLGRRVRAESP